MKQSAFQFIQPYLTHLEFSLTDKFSPQKGKGLTERTKKRRLEESGLATAFLFA